MNNYIVCDTGFFNSVLEIEICNMPLERGHVYIVHIFIAVVIQAYF